MRRLRWFALMWLALAVVVPGCKYFQSDTTAEEGAAQPKAEAATPEAGALLEEVAAEKARAESSKDFLGAEYLQKGDAAKARGEFEEARKFYLKVLDQDPGNVDAKQRLNEVGTILGMRGPSVRDALDDATAARKVRRQQAQAEITDLVRVGQRLEDDQDFDGAIRKYEKALLIVGLYPYEGDFMPGEEQLNDMIARATAGKVQADKVRDAAEKREAQMIKEAEERRLREGQEARVTQLFQLANIAMSRLQFDLAREYAAQILRLDPTNESAAKLERLALDAKLTAEESETRRNLQEQWRRAFEEVDKAALPQVSEVVFPEEWLSVQGLRKGYGFSRDVGGAVDPKAREIENVLATTMVNINFEDTPLQAAVNFLTQVANVNIIILPSVYEEKSEDELLVTLRADNITVNNALDLITLTKQLSHRIEKGVVQIGTEAEALGEMVLDLYDVKDLTVPIRSFPGEDINLTPSGGFGFGLFEEEEIEPIQAFEGDQLADLIRDTIDTDVWDEGGDVQFRQGGILIVKAPPETHRHVRELLDGLRATGGLTVSLETRFITVEDSFLQDIGVDVRGLGDQSGGLGVRGKGKLETFDDVFRGTVNAPGGIGSGNETGVFYNLNSDGDVRGRVENLLDVALGRSGLLTGAGGTAIQATYLDDTQAEVILRAVEKSARSTVVVAPKITVYNHERANVTVLNQVSYIQDFDVEIAQAAQIGDPIVQTLRDGVILDVTPIVSADRKYVTLELRPTVAILQRPIATFSTTLGNGPPVVIQLPELTIQRVRTTVTMPDGGILLLGGLKFFEEERLDSSVPWLNKIPILSFFWSRKGTFISRRNLVILIRAKILVLEEMEPAYGGR